MVGEVTLVSAQEARISQSFQIGALPASTDGSFALEMPPSTNNTNLCNRLFLYF